jgi:hypothetical protein
MALKITGEQENGHEKEKQGMTMFIRLFLVRILIGHFCHLTSQGDQIIVNSMSIDEQKVLGIVGLVIYAEKRQCLFFSLCDDRYLSVDRQKCLDRDCRSMRHET